MTIQSRLAAQQIVERVMENDSFFNLCIFDLTAEHRLPLLALLRPKHPSND